MKLDLSKYPPDMPWGPLAALSLTGVAVTIFLLFSDFGSAKWQVPAESQLQHATGTFLTRQPGDPYIFKTSEGGTLFLGCQPHGYSADCFDDSSAMDGAKRKISLGYFYVHNAQRSRLSDILVTVSSDGRELVSYAARKRELDVWAMREKSFRRVLIELGAGLMPTFVCFGMALAAFRSRMTRFRQQGPWGARESEIIV